MQPIKFPSLVLGDVVAFPDISSSLTIQSESGRLAIENIKEYDNRVVIFCKKNTSIAKEDESNISSIGVLCRVTFFESHKKETKVNIEGMNIFLSKYFKEENGILMSYGQILEDEIIDYKNLFPLQVLLFDKFKEYISYNTRIPTEVADSISAINKINESIFYISSIAGFDYRKKQEILDCKFIEEQAKKVIYFLDIENKIASIDKEISSKIDQKIMKRNKDMMFAEKIRFMKKEISEDFEAEDIDNDEINDIKKKIKSLGLGKELLEKCNKEIKRLSSMPVYSPEYGSIKEYLDIIASLPWKKNKSIPVNLCTAINILNKNHYGLDKVKERISEFLAKYIKTKKLSGSIICLAGPPGIGKTSLVRSIAEALNKEYIKISLGGLRDESEIRGHRKTYIGSMPGKIIKALQSSKVSNPVILLDEIDKMSSDFRGDPASAFLEVLDPEQNKHFNDRYIDAEYDLSNVLFIATANNIGNIPLALRDRMEIIRMTSYTDDEKLNIAKNYLIPKELKEHSMSNKEIKFDDKIIKTIIREYTYEAGVRGLNRVISKIIRKINKSMLLNEIEKNSKVNLNIDNISDYLGHETISESVFMKEDSIGVTNGLAYSELGGSILSIEVLKFSGTGKLVITGKLGDVMKESIQAAFSYVRSIASNFKISSEEFSKYDFHIHVPEGATPKDGPSAGLAISGALMSSITGVKVKHKVAMTGEITLTGKVLPIGGLKEKLLAAIRNKIKTVIIPSENLKNIKEFSATITDKLEIIPVSNIEDGFKVMLKNYKKSNK